MSAWSNRALASSALISAFVLAAVAGCGSKAPASTSSTAAVTAPAGVSGCTRVPLPKLRARTEKAPTSLLPTGAHFSITFDTNCGDFTIAITPSSAPHAAASFVSLAKKGFFDHTIFHRIVPGFVIQGGDPTGTGTGGPGYATVDTPAKSSQYTLGVVAMAKTAAEPAGYAGSQFFIVTEANASLPPDYAIIGDVSSGLNVVEKIGTLGNVETQQPTMVVEIEKVIVSDGG